MVSQKIKCILKAIAIPIIVALITFALGMYVLMIVLDSFGGYDPNMPSALDNSHWTQTTAYQSSCFALAPIIATILIIAVVILGYYWFVKPCLIKEKIENGDKT